MTREMDAASEIEKFIGEECAADLASVGRDEDLLATDILDSLMIVELVSFLETRFGIQVRDDDLLPENFKTVNEIVAFVERKRG